jgi:uncharacterized DUF497 family protein
LPIAQSRSIRSGKSKDLPLFLPYAFSDPFALNLPDDDHSEVEDRWVLLGMASPNRLVVVVHTDRAAGKIRIISARRATRAERVTYEARLQR